MAERERERGRERERALDSLPGEDGDEIVARGDGEHGEAFAGTYEGATQAGHPAKLNPFLSFSNGNPKFTHR